jgi:hypothetical protein
MQQTPTAAETVMATAQLGMGIHQTFSPGGHFDLSQNEYFQKAAVLTITGPYAGLIIFEIVDPFDVAKELEYQLSYFD